MEGNARCNERRKRQVRQLFRCEGENNGMVTKSDGCACGTDLA